MRFRRDETLIPPKKNRKEQRDYDKYLYKMRHLVESCFLVLKRWRGIITCYAKTLDAFIAAVHVRCIAIWFAIRANPCRRYLRMQILLNRRKHRLTMVNTPLNKALGVRNQIFHSNDTRSAVAWTWERMMSATCRRSSKSMLSQFPRWEDRYSIFCGETLSAFSAAISFISP